MVLLIWVLLSGIGGYAFQNPDFHARNALLNDLINYKWPVIYNGNPWGNAGNQYVLTYYIGFWLPAALIGKVLGWNAANFALFLWALGGVILTVFLLHKILKTKLVYCAILLITFSGMDILSNLLLKTPINSSYPTLWPPISHLEWTIPVQYSSITTQLYWVFNQAIPTWIVLLLLFTASSRKYHFFLWSLCFFFAPLPAIGLLPILFVLIIKPDPDNPEFEKPHQNTINLIIKDVVNRIKQSINVENFLSSISITLITFIYFSSNSNKLGVKIIPINFQSILIISVFILFEFLILWLLLFDSHKKEVLWYTVGAVLLIFPWIHLGSSPDFCMRASIPELMILMIWAGQALLAGKSFRYRILLVCVLVLGAMTPLYEINRSIYRTATFWIKYKTGQDTGYNPPTHPQVESLPKFDMVPETDHPASLWAMDYPSLRVFDLDKYYQATVNINHSLFAQTIMRK